MPRNKAAEALQALAVSSANYKAAEAARVRARVDLDKSMIRAVKAGVTRYEVGKAVGVSHQRVAQVPGMPKGSTGSRKNEG